MFRLSHLRSAAQLTHSVPVGFQGAGSIGVFPAGGEPGHGPQVATFLVGADGVCESTEVEFLVPETVLRPRSLGN